MAQTNLIIVPRAERSPAGVYDIPDITLGIGETHDMSQYIATGDTIASSQIIGLDTNVATYDSGTMLLTGVTGGTMINLVMEVVSVEATVDFTYTATHYVSATGEPGTVSQAAYDAATSESTPCSFTCALRYAIAGDYVQVGAGLYQIDPQGAQTWVAAFAPWNSGIPGNPIVFFAETPAAYNSDNTSILSELRKTTNVLNGDATLSNRSDDENGIQNYIIFDGFYTREALSMAGPNKGVYQISNGTGVEYRRCWIDRTNLVAYGTGYVGASYYPHSAVDCRIVDCLATGNDTLSIRNDAVVIIYNSERLTVEHNEFDGAGWGVHIKTDDPDDAGILEDCHVRYNKITASNTACINTQSSQGSYIYHNLLIGSIGITHQSVSVSSKTWNAGGGQVQIYNNTIVCSGGTYTGALTIENQILPLATSLIHSNVIVQRGSARTVWAPFETSTWASSDLDAYDRIDYNSYEDSSPDFQINGTRYSSMNAYQTAMQVFGLNSYSDYHEANSILTTHTFVNEAGGNYRLASNGQAALNAALGGGATGADFDTYEIGLRANPAYPEY